MCYKEAKRMQATLNYCNLEAGSLADEVNDKTGLTAEFHHRSLRERSAEYGGSLNLSDEMDWGEPSGRELW
jgi:hypothetical protein